MVCNCMRKERETAMLEVLNTLKSQHGDLRTQAEQEDVQLIAAVELSRLKDADLEPLRVALAKLEKKCRKLQNLRKELLQEQDRRTQSGSAEESGSSDAKIEGTIDEQNLHKIN